MRLLLAAVLGLLASEALAQDFTQYKPQREFPFAPERPRLSPDFAHVYVEKGLVRTADWTLDTTRLSLVKDVFFTQSPPHAAVITTDGLWVYSTKTWLSAGGAGVGGTWTQGDLNAEGKILVASGTTADSLVVVTGWDREKQALDRRTYGVVTMLGFVSKDRFVTVGRSGQVALWSAIKEKSPPLRETVLEKSSPSQAVFAPDRKAVYVPAANGVHRLTVSDLKDICAAPEGYDPASRIAVGPRGRYVAVFSEKSPVQILDAATLEPRGKFGGGEVTARAAAFTPDDKFIAIASAKANRIHVYQSPEWEPAAEIDLVTPPHRILMGPDAKWMLVVAPPKTYVLAPDRKR